MATEAAPSLQFISAYDPQGGLITLVNEPELPLALELTLFIKDKTIALMHHFTDRRHSIAFTRELRGRIQRITASGSYNKLCYDLMSLSKGHARLAKAVNQFQQTLTMLAQSPISTSFMCTTSMHFGRSPSPLMITYPKPLPLMGELHGDALITALLGLNPQQQEEQYRFLSAQQVIELSYEERSKQLFPRIFVTIPHATLNQLLLGVNDDEHAHLRSLFEQLQVHSLPWFTQGFKIIRQRFADICNAQAAAIDQLDRDFRLIESNSHITEKHILRARELAGDIELAYQAEERLRNLISGIIVDPLTIRLFQEMPYRYSGLSKRVSEELSEHQNVSGCPYGILYLLAFDDPEDDSQEELLKTVCEWGFTRWENWVEYRLITPPDDITRADWESNPRLAYEAGLKHLETIGIKSIRDLMRLKIFNAQMLASYNDWKTEKHIDAKRGNIIEQLINYFWRPHEE